MRAAFIAEYVRSPFQPAQKGKLRSVRPDDLLASVVSELVRRSGISPEQIEDLICGCAFPEAEQGYNLGRQVALLAGLPVTCAGVTVNRFCGSSMQAVHQAVGAIAIGAGDVMIAAGVESMSRVPMLGFNPMFNPALQKLRPDVYVSMGCTAEALVDKYQIARQRQEEFAVESHRRADHARANGCLTAEIVPIETKEGTVLADGCIRSGATVEDLSTLKPVFKQGGSVTAGTSSPLTDGAAALLITTEDVLETLGVSERVAIRSVAVSGCEPLTMGYGPVPAARKALARAGIAISDLDVIESNEAFAVQALLVSDQLGLPSDRTNVDGGALAIGHPLGATGARIVGKTAQLLSRTNGKWGLAMQCIGGGQGIATVLERLK
jgi:acetyl-CoA acyltransferase